MMIKRDSNHALYNSIHSEILFWVFIILFLTCNNDKTPTGPQFTSLEEEKDHTKCLKELEMCCLNSNF